MNKMSARAKNKKKILNDNFSYIIVSCAPSVVRRQQLALNDNSSYNPRLIQPNFTEMLPRGLPKYKNN